MFFRLAYLHCHKERHKMEISSERRRWQNLARNRLSSLHHNRCSNRLGLPSGSRTPANKSYLITFLQGQFWISSLQNCLTWIPGELQMWPSIGGDSGHSKNAFGEAGILLSSSLIILYLSNKGVVGVQQQPSQTMSYLASVQNQPVNLDKG